MAREKAKLSKAASLPTRADVPTIDEALSDPNVLGIALGDLETWRTWRVILKAAFGLPLDADELVIFKTVAGDRQPPTQRVAELSPGRRGANRASLGL
jgi:hypothetical protein